MTWLATWRELARAIATVSGEREAIVLSSLPAPVDDSSAAFSYVEVPAGRAIALATGLRAALPDAPLFLVMNADSITLGTNHLIHAARRNVDMTVLLLRAELTADPGDVPARTSWSVPAYQRALETVPTPLDWITSLEAAYVGRALLGDGERLVAVLREALHARGFAAVGITANEALPTGRLSASPWPEHFAAYRTWAAALRERATARPVQRAPTDMIAARDVPRCEVRIAGLGGQGIKLAGTVLAEAAGLRCGLWATERGDYGSATRGGPSSVDVVIGSTPITYPSADHADVLVLLTQAAADRHARTASARARIIADATNVRTPPHGALVVPILELAREHAGKPIAAGIVSLGCVAAVSAAVPMDALHATMDAHVPGAVLAANKAACAAGYAATRAMLNGGST